MGLLTARLIYPSRCLYEANYRDAMFATETLKAFAPHSSGVVFGILKEVSRGKNVLQDVDLCQVRTFVCLGSRHSAPQISPIHTNKAERVGSVVFATNGRISVHLCNAAGSDSRL